MNILYIVFKFQENSSKNTSVEKNEEYVEILHPSKAATEGALL